MAAVHVGTSVVVAARRSASDTPASLTSTRTPSISAVGVALAPLARLEDDTIAAV
jgi:hypothetical protein